MNYLTLENCLQYSLGKVPLQEELRSVLNLKQSTISNRARRNGNIKNNEIELINKYYNINLLEIEKTLAQHMKDEKNIVLPDSITINYYDTVFGSCGGGNFVFSEEKSLIDVPIKSIAHYSNFKKYSVINASGDSMTPFIHHADKLIVEHWNGEQIIDNSIYVFRYIDSIYVKRLVQNVDQIIVKSDNKEYQPRYITLENCDNLQIIGKIVGLMREIY